MSHFSLSLFPLPLAIKGEIVGGAYHKIPDKCVSCATRDCLKTKNQGLLELCPNGFNYQRVDPDTIIFGLVVKDFPTASTARLKLLKKERDRITPRSSLESAIQALKQTRATSQALIDAEKAKFTREYVKTQQFKTDFLKQLQADIQKGLSFVHDYKQVNAQIRQNINVIIENKYQSGDFESKLARATHEEKAIYESSKFLEEKLASTKFLLHPEWMDRINDCEWSRLHGLVHKYLKIYQSRFEAKGVKVEIIGESFQKIFANRQALAVIPHTLIDNAAKYAAKNSSVEVTIHDSNDSIIFSVSSYGPAILAEELEKIFQPFYRGKLAEKVEEEGSGYGLYISQLIAKRHLGTEISVTQDAQETRGMGYWTTFTIVFPLKTVIAK